MRRPISWIAVTLALCLASATRTSVAPPQARPLDLYWIDVEGGAATLIVTPAGESVLIDTGYPDERGAPRIHKVATEVAGLTRIDHLVVTHFHLDHFGGAMSLAKLMPVGRVYDNGSPSPPPGEEDRALFDAYKDAFPGRRTLDPGDRLALAPSAGPVPLTLRLLGTRQRFVPPPADAAKNDACAAAAEREPDSSDNANSTVWLLELGPFKFFNGGDLTWNTEARVVCPVNLAGTVDVYQVNHHGLDVSNNPVLIRSLAPTVSVMNNGARKGTEPQTMATLRSVSSIRAMYQVHRNVREGREDNAPDAHIANLAERCGASFIHLSVQPDGGRYTIEIPARGHKATYETRAARGAALKP